MNGTWFHYEAESFIIIHTCNLLPAITYKMSLIMLKGAVKNFLRSRIHIDQIKLASQGRGTKPNTLFQIKASNSYFINNFQFGSDKASLGF